MPAGPFGFGPFPIDPDDPNVQAAILRQKQADDDLTIKNLEWKENFANFLKKCSQTDVEVLSNIFYHLERDPGAARFYLGLVHGVSMLKYDTCPMCAEDHAEALHKGVEQELKNAAGENEYILNPDRIDTRSGVVSFPELETTVDQMAMSGQDELDIEIPHDLDDAKKKVRRRVLSFDYNVNDPSPEEREQISGIAFLPPPHPLPEKMDVLAGAWGLSDTWEEGAPGELKFIGWVCTNCGSVYASIQDRMLKPMGVEGCSGCQQKAKWG